jgi:HSP20 family protein
MANEERRSGVPARGGQERGQQEMARRRGGGQNWFDEVFDRMQRDFDMMRSGLFGGGLFPRLQMPASREGGFERLAHVEFEEADGELVVSVELPGIDPKQVQVECREDMLTIQGERRSTEGGAQREIRFFRQVQLPDDIDVDKAKASFSNGLLRLRFPRQEQRASVKRIPIGAEEGPQGGSSRAA